MNNLPDHITTIVNKIVYVIFTILCTYMFLASIFGTCVMVYTDEHTFYLKDFAILMCLGLAAFVVLLTLLKGKVLSRSKRSSAPAKVHTCNSAVQIAQTPQTWLYLIPTILWLLILIWIILNTQLPMVYDQGRVLGGAQELVNGDYTNWGPYNYFYAYPYINGMPLMEVPFVWIFGENALLALQFANIAFWYITILGITWFATQYFGPRAAGPTYLALLAFVPMWFYMTFVYGTIPGLCFSVCAFVCEKQYEKTTKWRYLIASIVLIFFGVAWKSNYQIFLIALMLMYIMHSIRSRNWKPLVGAAASLALLGFELTWISMFVRSFTGQSIDGGTPTITWITMGLQESSIAPGWYNSYTELMYEQYDHNVETIKQVATQDLWDRLAFFASQPEYCLRFFFRKIASMWNNPAFQSFTIVSKRNVHGSLSYLVKDIFYDGGILNIILRVIMDVMHTITLFGLVLHVVCRRGKLKWDNALLAITFLGGFAFHLVWEAMGQYALPYYVLLFPYAVDGYHQITDKLLTSYKEKRSIRQLAASGTGKIFLGLGILIVFIAVSNFTFVNSTIKLGGEEKDYLYYCQNQTEWKNEDYYKQ